MNIKDILVIIQDHLRHYPEQVARAKAWRTDRGIRLDEHKGYRWLEKGVEVALHDVEAKVRGWSDFEFVELEEIK